MSVLFAATYPERTAALVVRSAYPRRMWAPDYPWGRTEADYEREVERDLRVFGPRDQATQAVRALGRFEDDEVRHLVDYLRFGSSPGTLEALHRMNREIDVREVLPAVRVPSLILHGSEDTIVPLEVARYMASRMPSARIVEIPGAGHLAFGKPAALVGAEIERFLKDVWEPEAGRRKGLTACSRPCSSPTSSARPNEPPPSATVPGVSCSSAIITCARPSRTPPLPRRGARHCRGWLLRPLRRPRARDSMCLRDRRRRAPTRARGPRRRAHR